MIKKILTVSLFVFVSLISVAQQADYSKMSHLVRKFAVQQKQNEASAKGTKSSEQQTKKITAFVRTDNTENLELLGCKVITSLDDIHIVQIPLDKLASVSQLSEVKRIEAGQRSRINLDHTRHIVNVSKTTDEQWNNDQLQFNGYSGKNSLVGVVDVGIDISHPTFWSADGTRYRVKALWDQIARRSGGNDADYDVPVGKEYLTQDELISLRHTLDAPYFFHGTHTSAIAAGSGWNGTSDTQYVGMAPEADICMVCNCSGNNSELVPEEYEELYTDAMDVLAFKYIFDYAEKQGKPCVINFSEGRSEDFYAGTMYYDAVEKLLGPGRILCAAAGNDGESKTYIHKDSSKESVSTFIKAYYGSSAIFMRSDDKFTIELGIYSGNKLSKKVSYSFDDVAERKDSFLIDTLNIGRMHYKVDFGLYPSGVNPDDYGIEFYVINLDEGQLGYTNPISLTVKGAGTDVELFSSLGELMSNTALIANSISGEKNHFICYPGATKDVICVGSTTYSRSAYKGPDSFSGGKRSSYSSVGPTIQGFIKPDVMAPGEKIYSAISSAYIENNTDDITDSRTLKTFRSNSHQYGWELMSGTSMATPVVTGVVALWLDVCPTLSPSQILEVISKTSTQYNTSLSYPNNEYGWGEINAKAGIEYIQENFTGIVDISLSDKNIDATKKCYDINGRVIPFGSSYRGIVLERQSNGKVRKLLKK